MVTGPLVVTLTLVKYHQVVLRAAARLVLQLPYRSSVSEIMHRQLHRLDVVDWVNYKIGLLVYKCLHGLAPGYLSDQCISASTVAGRDNMHSSTRLDRLVDYCTSQEPKQRHWVHEGSITPRLPCGTRSLWTCVIPDSRSTKLKSHFFTDDWFFFRWPFMYFIIVAFSPCAPTWCLLAGAYKCLNWIEWLFTRVQISNPSLAWKKADIFRMFNRIITQISNPEGWRLG